MIGKNMKHKLFVYVASVTWACTAQGADLNVHSVNMFPNSFSDVVVSGTIKEQATFGVTLMVELVPRPGARGSVRFTPVRGSATVEPASYSIDQKIGTSGAVLIKEARRSDVDVVQRDDPWPVSGTFSAFDTDRTGSPTLNGAVDDNGVFVPSVLNYSGVLATFPVVSSADAAGIWDVLLVTSVGTSGWEGVENVLTGGTITVRSIACSTNKECNDGNPCTSDICDRGTCVNTRVEGDCTRGGGNATSFRRAKRAELKRRVAQEFKKESPLPK